MTKNARRGAAAGICILAIVLAAVWSFVGSSFIGEFAKRHLSREVPLSQAIGPRPDAYDDAAKPYNGILVISLVLATGTSAAAIVLAPRSDFRVRGIAYAIFLAIILPATVYNYDQGDIVLKPGLQAGLNLILKFLAATVSLWLSGSRGDGPDQKVLKMMSLFLMVGAGVMAPGILTLLWALNRIGLLGLAESRKFELKDITGLAGVGSAIISWLNYRRDRVSATPVEPSRIILP
jgi:hypothetical protein